VKDITVGQEVTYNETGESGFVKSWNNTYIFVVFSKCANKDNFMNYTAAACKREDLTINL
jgi:hypothetical protein